MSVQPNIIDGSVSTPQGVAQRFADLQRQIHNIVQTASFIPPGSVTGGQVATGTLTGTNIVTGSLTATQIAAGTIVTENLSAGSITADLIAAGAVVTDKLAANSVTADKIAANTITAENIAAGTITATEIAAHTITSDQIAAGAIASGSLAAGAVTAGDLAVGAVTAGSIAVGAVQAANIDVAYLSAISAIMGTVTGGIFQTNAVGARAIMGTGITTSLGTVNGIVGIDGSNNVTFFVDAATGNVTLKGTLQQGSDGLGNVAGITQNGVISIQGNNLIDNAMPTSGDLSPFTPTNAAVTVDSTFFLLSPSSLKATVGTSAAWSLIARRTGGARAAIGSPSTAYSASVLIYTSAVRSFTLGIAWYDSGGALISTTTSPAQASLVNQWNRVTWENQVAPSNAATAQVIVTGTGHTAGEVQHLTNFIFTNQKTATGSMLSAQTISATEILSGTITATQIAAASITGDRIAASTITGGTIAAGTITADKIAANSITATQLSATAIDAMTITGATIRTSSATAKVQLNSGGLVATDATGTTTFSLSSAGSFTLNFNVIANGTFDTTINGWAVVETQPTAGGAAWQASPSGTAPGAMIIGFSGATTYTGAGYIAVPVVPGQTYAVNVKLQSENGTGTYYVRMIESSAATLSTGYVGWSGAAITVDNRTSFTELVPGGGAESTIQTTMHPFSYTYTVPAGVNWVTLAIYSWGSSGWLYVDDVSMRLTSTPPAGTIRGGTFIGGTFQGTYFSGAVFTGGTFTGTSFSGATLTGGTIQTSATNPKVIMYGPWNGVFATNSAGALILGLDPVGGLRLITAGSYNSLQAYGTMDWFDSAIGSFGGQTGSIGVYSGGPNASNANARTLFLTAGNTTGTNGQANAATGLLVTYDSTTSATTTTNIIARCYVAGSIGQTTVATLLDAQGNSWFLNVFAAQQANYTGAPYAIISNSGFVGSNSGSPASPASSIVLTNQVGGLPGFASNTYPVLKSSYAALYISVGGSNSGFFNAAGTYTASSGVSTKQNFKALKHDDVLSKIETLDVREWEHIVDPGVRRVGPVAEDFHAKFGLGTFIPDPKKRTKPEHEPMLAPSDVAGVALLGVQGLVKRVKALEAEVATLKTA